MNRVTLIGNLTADPEIRRLNDGEKVANLRLATNEHWTDKATGERRSRADFHRIVSFSTPLIDAVIAPHARKGKQVSVEGQLRTRQWVDQGGITRYTTEILIGPRGSFQLLGTPRPAVGPAGPSGSEAESELVEHDDIEMPETPSERGNRVAARAAGMPVSLDDCPI